MKIMQVIPSFGIGGAETMCENLIYSLKRQGQNVVVVSLYSFNSPITERIENSGISIYYLDKKQGLDFSCIRKLKKIIKKEKPDIIHTHLYAIKYAILSTLFKGIKIVHTLHSVADKEANGRDRKFNKFFFKKRKAIPVALSEAVKETVVEVYKLKYQIPVVYNGIDLSRLIVKNDYDKKEKFVLINVARFSLPKNHLRLIDSFNLFNKKYPDSELWLIGDGELKGQIVDKISQVGLEKEIKLLGMQGVVSEYLNKADVFVLSSDYEGIPMSVIEAMGSGLPVVATNVGGLTDMIDDGKNGLLTQLSDKDIFEKIERLYLDRSLRKEIGINAIEKAKIFSSENMAKKYCDIYSKIK